MVIAIIEAVRFDSDAEIMQAVGEPTPHGARELA